jgi:type IX secretion system PorP/SprF family membrane protein
MSWHKLYKVSYLLVIHWIFVCMLATAQQLPQYALQEFVRPGVNPAYTGLEGIYDMVLLTRQQWAGMDGAPRSYYLSSNVPLRSRRAGVGFMVQSQSAGPYIQSEFFLNYSYTVNLAERSTLSFGLRGGLNGYRLRVSDLRVIDQGDYLFENDVMNLIRLNFGTGVHYTIRNYYVDFSIPMLLRNGYNPGKANGSIAEDKSERIYNIQAGASYRVLEGFALEPALAVWLTGGAPPLIDIRLSTEIRDAVQTGLVYRVSGSFSGYFSFRVLDNLVLGYAYELPLAYDYRLSSGTHEAVLGLDFQLFNKKTLSPRRF